VYIGPQAHHVTKIGTKLKPEEEAEIFESLKRNFDIFAWQSSDIPGIYPSIACHHLDVLPGVKPVTQRKRKLGEERRKAVDEEVKKLANARFISEIKYPTWLDNIVLVKKATKKWRMCVDYTNLNMACPKDPYLLPNINHLIDNTSS
jgi:hypothetical protein